MMQNEIEDAILAKGDWDYWAARAEHHLSEYHLTADSPHGVIRVNTEGSKLSRSGDSYYGEYEQGSEEEVYILFEVKGGDEHPMFFKKFGVADSYGEANFNGRFRQVIPKQKTVVVYDYE